MTKMPKKYDPLSKFANQCKWVAEIGSNHNGSKNRVREFVLICSKLGIWGIKFQFIDGSLYEDGVVRHPIFPMQFRDELEDLYHLCHENGLAVGYTVFSRDGCSRVKKYADFLKIGSYDILNHELIKCAARATDMLVISTGMAFEVEIKEAYDQAKPYCRCIYLIHCTSEYPADPKSAQLINVGRVPAMVPVSVSGKKIARSGWSDHTLSPAVMYRAFHVWSPDYIEFHLDDGNGEESAHSWKPLTIKRVINTCRLGVKSDGRNQRNFSDREMRERNYRANPKTGKRPVPSEGEEVA